MSDIVTRLNAALSGRYRIERKLGEGGMATVYLADDLRHERKVALKVLKPELAAVVGAERFLAEIKTTANLQHPHILPLFDSGEADSFLFYVMPYVEGESLRERLDREHQLPVEEAVKIASDVAEALQAAHDQGVIHRDVKPANILLSKGRPLVSDFGIALALGAAGAGRLTETGLSLGTPHYMSPEQATGDLSVGAATDIYALGCVLYEMLVGEPPYTGGTPQAILGKIIQAEPASATKARRSVPAHVDAAIRKSLEKIPADRFTGAHALVRALGDSGFTHGASAAGVGAVAGGSAGRRALPWALAAAFAATTLVFALRPSGESSTDVVRLTIPLVDLDSVRPEDPDPFTRYAQRELDVSPDGQLVVWRQSFPAPQRLYLRRLDQETAVALEGAGNAFVPTFSPDGAWIAFFELENEGYGLKRISVTDGRVETIATLPGTQFLPGLAWGDDGTLVANDHGTIYRVPATGGAWEGVRPDRSGSFGTVGSPVMLPGGETLLYHVRVGPDPSTAEIRAMDLATGEERTLVEDAMNPVYVPSGHLVFVRSGALMAVRFDARRLEALGQPAAFVDVMQQVYSTSSTSETGAAQVAVSATGTLVYAGGGVLPARPEELVRLTPGGDTLPMVSDGRSIFTIRVSPDGRRLAFASLHGVQQGDLWVRDLARGLSQRVESGAATVIGVEWSPDGASLVYTGFVGEEPAQIYRIAADGTGVAEALTETTGSIPVVSSVAPDGSIAYMSLSLERFATGDLYGDIWVLPPGESPRAFLTGEGGLAYPTFSPDGRWLAYVSRANGTRSVYVRPYPGPGAPTLVAGGEALAPAWSRDGGRLYYKAPGPDGRFAIMSVGISTEGGLRLGTPERVMLATGSSVPRTYDVFADGSIVDRVPTGPAQNTLGVRELHVVVNFAQELKERLPE